MADIIATVVAPDGIVRGEISAACDAVRGTAGPVIDGVACAIACAGEARDIRATLEPLARWDLFVRRADAPPARLLVADMDSTMITVECIDELADYAGIKAEVAAITVRAMAGELDFRAALAERVALLAGLREQVIEDCLAERVRPTPGAEVLIRTLKACGVRSVLVSGGFTRFAGPVAAMIGFDHVVANVLEIADGVLTGRVLPPIVDSAAKLAALNAELAALRAGASEAIAIGDGANDVPMLAAAGQGIAYRGHPAAVAAAGASVRFGDLTGLLWAQGIARSEWAG